MPTVLDTQAWMWRVNGDRRLSRRARTTIDRASLRGELFLSIYSIWEATSRSLSATLVTRDTRLRDYPHVRCVW